MIRTAALRALLLVASNGSVAGAQSPAPQAYTLRAEGTLFDRKMTLTVLRDGAREQVVRTIDRSSTTTLYDFESRRVYWMGWSGPGTCSSGRYRSARAPVADDPVTGTAETLTALAAGRTRRAAGAGAVAGMAARIELFEGGKRPTDPDAFPWPKRAWLAEEGGYLLKLEGEAQDGRPVTMLEVTQLTFARPATAALAPPATCTATDSEMDDTGELRARGQGSVEVAASATADLATGATSATVTKVEGKPAAQPIPGRLAQIGALSLEAETRPHEGRCGLMRLTGRITVDGPSTIRFQLVPSVGGLQFPDGPDGTVEVDGAGTATLVREAVSPRALKGQVRLRAMVMGTKGHNGPLKTSDPVPFEATCTGR